MEDNAKEVKFPVGIKIKWRVRKDLYSIGQKTGSTLIQESFRGHTIAENLNTSNTDLTTSNTV
jgi:hypothetical protein